MFLLYALLLLSSFGKEVQYFPSVLYGHILIGPGTSRYETIFAITARKETRATLELFTDKGEPMQASFTDEHGKAASTGNSFEFFLTPDRPVAIRLALAAEDMAEDVAVKTGWATFQSSEEIEVAAVVRITTPEGKILSRHVLGAQKAITGD
jgi:hypothetical protein